MSCCSTRSSIARTTLDAHAVTAPSGILNRQTSTRAADKHASAAFSSSARMRAKSIIFGCDASPSVTLMTRIGCRWAALRCIRPPDPRVSSSGWGATTTSEPEGPWTSGHCASIRCQSDSAVPSRVTSKPAASVADERFAIIYGARVADVRPVASPCCVLRKMSRTNLTRMRCADYAVQGALVCQRRLASTVGARGDMRPIGLNDRSGRSVTGLFDDSPSRRRTSNC